MDKKVAKIEQSLHQINERLKELEFRISQLEQTKVQTSNTSTSSSFSEENEEESSFVHSTFPKVSGTKLFSILGRTFLVLAGAFLLRVFTENELIPVHIGAIVGLIYAVIWLYFSNQAAKKHEIVSANFHGVTSVIIAFPLLFEASTKLNIFNPVTTISVLVVITTIALIVSAHRNLRWVYIFYVLAAFFISFPLMYKTGKVELYTIFLLLVSLSTLLFKYFKNWHFLPWISTFLLNVAIMFIVSLASYPEKLVGKYSELSIPFSLTIIISYVIIYLSVFITATLYLKRQISVLGIFQSLFALIVGLIGALTITHGTGAAYYILGSFAAVFSVSFYFIAFLYINPEKKVNFYYYTWMAFVLAIAGIWVLCGNNFRVLSFSLLSFITVYLTRYIERFNTLSIQSALYIMLAAIFSGVIKLSIASFMSTENSFAPFSFEDVLLIAFILFIYIIHIILSKESFKDINVPRFGILVISVTCVFGLLISFLINTLELNTTVEFLNTPLLKTIILSLAAIFLAWLSSKTKIYEISLLVYPLLILGGIKILVNDISKGTPTTLFIGFLVYGLALIFAPKLKPKRKD